MILNKDLIILSSDLAVTTPENKSYNCGTKIFEIKENLPVAVMINGNLDFEEISLETLIGEFGKTIDYDKIKSVEGVKDELIKYLSENTKSTSLDEYLSWILDDFKEELCYQISENGFDYALATAKQKELPDYIKDYKNFSKEFFDLIPDDKDKAHYNQEIWKMFSHHLSFEGTGMVFAGFDLDNFHPSYSEINLHCNNCGEIIYDEVDSGINCKEPVIKVFAINEEAYTFLTGVSSDFEDYLKSYLKYSKDDFLLELKEKLASKNYDSEEIKYIVSSLNLYLNDSYSNICDIIENYKLNTINQISESSGYLPKTILWELASHLIVLTALKQKFSSENENVSIETEGVFISKKIGVEWIVKDYESLNKTKCIIIK